MADPARRLESEVLKLSPELDPVATQIALWSDEIESDWKRAVAAGAVIVKPLEPKPWGQTAGYLRDQDGIIVELCTPSPRETRTH